MAGRSCTVRAEHPPWSLCEATLVALDQSLLAVNGLARPAEPPFVRYSPGTDAFLRVPRRSVFPISPDG